MLDYTREWGTPGSGLPQTAADWPPYFNWLMATIKNMGLSVGPLGATTYQSNATLVSQMDFGVPWNCVQLGTCGLFLPLGELALLHALLEAWAPGVPVQPWHITAGTMPTSAARTDLVMRSLPHMASQPLGSTPCSMHLAARHTA